jgi:thiol-disulfide isomerase/thioredoxin
MWRTAGVVSVAVGLALLGGPALSKPADRAAQVETIQRAIWASFDKSAKPDARARALAGLEPLVAANPKDAAGVRALGLLFRWGTPAQSGRALSQLVTHAAPAALATQLELGYADAAAPAKRTTLERLVNTSTTDPVVFTVRYLLAVETLGQPSVLATQRTQALRDLRLVRDRATAVPTQLLGAGSPPRLSNVAAATLFQREQLVPGARLPTLSARDLAGKPVTSAAFKGKVVLLDFWATWCVPCIAAFPKMKALQARWPKAPFEIVGISGDARPELVTTFLQRTPLPWTHWHAGMPAQVHPMWDVTSFPFYMLVDRQGRIVATSTSFDEIAPKVEATLRQHG